MNNIYKTFEKINNFPRRINILKMSFTACMAVIAIVFIFFYEKLNLFITILLCLSAIIAIILFIVIHMFEKSIEKKLSELKKQYREIKIKYRSNVSDISVTILGTTFLRGPESDGNILIIAILVDNTIEYQHMSKHKLEEIFE